MYAVNVDLVVRYVPPMHDHHAGIRLTRTIELPFPPAKDISVFSKDWEDLVDPMGYVLKEVTWDADRNCFLADTEVSDTGLPIALIPHDIRRLVDHGWKYGSYKDGYQTERKRGRKHHTLPAMRIRKWDFDEAASWEANRKDRPKEFNLVLRAIVATMAELHNNCAVAYAMLKTACFLHIPDQKPASELSPLEKRFRQAIDDYHRLTSDQQWDWCDRVKRRYPRLADIVQAIK